MLASFSVLALVAVVVITLYMGFLNLLIWVVQRVDRTPLWQAAWLIVSAVYAFFRIVQFAPISEPLSIVVPRILMTAAYSLAWLGYEIGNSFIGFRPPRWERTLILSLVALTITLVWTSNLIFTDQPITRIIPFAGSAHGAVLGMLFIPVSILTLGLIAIPSWRLIRAQTRYRRENLLMAMGFLFVILFNLIDIIAIALNAAWIRLADYSYLPVAIFFSYIQGMRFGLLYQDMSAIVDEHTAELTQANATLRTSEHKFSTAFRTSPDSININRLSDGLYYEINDGFTALTGYTTEDVKGKTSLELDIWANPEDRANLIKVLREHGEVTNLEAIFKMKNGHRMVGLMSARIIHIEGETCILSITRDISDLKQAEEAIRRQAEEMTALYETTHDLVIERDLPKLLHTIVERAAGLLSASGGGLYLCEPEQRQARCVVSYNTPRDYTGTALNYGDGAAGIVAETGEPLIIDDYRVWAGRALTYEEEQPFVSVLSVPMRWQDQVIGVIHLLDNARVCAFDAQDLRVLTLFANQAVIAIENSRLLAETRRRADEFAALYEVTRDLVSQRDLHSLLEAIVERAASLLSAPAGTIFLYDAFHDNLDIVVAKGFHPPPNTQMELGEGMAGRVAQTRQPLIVDNYSTWEHRSPKYDGIGMTASIQAPMLYGDELIGVLDVSELHITNHKFTDADLRLLTLFANQAAIAIQNAHLFESEQRRRQETAAIADVGRDISASLQLDVVLERIVWHAKNLLRAVTSAVYLSDPGSHTLRAIAAFGPDADEIKRDHLKIGEGILGDIAARKVGEIVNDNAEDARAITIKGTEDVPIEHLMGVPVLSRDKLAGLIAVWRIGEDQEFKSAELDFLTSLAQQAAIAIENAGLFAAEQNRRQEAETLRDAAQKITATLDQEHVIQLILDQLAKVVPYESASVQLLRDGYLEIVGGQGWPDPSAVLGIRFPVPGDNPNTLVIQGRGPLILGNVLKEYSPFKEPPHSHIQSWLGAPLIVRDRVIGMFAVDHSQPDFFTEADAQMVNALAGQAAIAIENTRLFEETRRRLTELEILQTIASALRIAQTLDEVFPIILDQLIELLDFDSALVDLLDPGRREIVSVLAHGAWSPITGLRTPDDVGVSCQVIASGQPYITIDVIGDGLIARPDMVWGVNAVACVPIVAQQHPIGTLWVGRRSRAAITAEEVNLLSALGEMVGNTIQRMKLHEQTVHQAQEISLAYDLTLEGWAKALELRDKETEGHSRRVTELTLHLARQFGIPEAELTHIHRGVLLHDIGKMGVPDNILKKAGPLNDEEWAEMRKHPQYAYDLINPIDYLRPALDIPYYHHEKWDGSGYPRGLKGEQIPIAARIFAVVDVYDALTCDRPYRAAWPKADVLSYLRDQAGRHFDPAVVDAFFASPFDI